MTDPALQIPEVIQTASINPAPSAEHDVNPPTAASEKQPIVEDDVASEAGSIPSDVVDPHRMIKPVSRRHHLPPLPDLRFEQSYLASLRGADTWGRVAWITIRDQVGHQSALQYTTGTSQLEAKESSKLTRIVYIGPPPSNPGHRLDSRSLWLAILEPQRVPQWPDTR